MKGIYPGANPKPLSAEAHDALRELDWLAASLGVTASSLAQYAYLTGGYTNATRPRSDALLPPPGTDAWYVISEQVHEIAEKCGGLTLRYALNRRAALAKIEVTS